METYIVIVSGSTAKRFHCSFEWHLTPHIMTLSIETCIRRTPCIKRTLQHSLRVLANYDDWDDQDDCDDFDD